MDSHDRSPLEATACFSPGQLIQHKHFHYRGVVVDVDATFQLSEEWYDEVARSRPPKDQPWYHVLVHDGDQMTYVAQRNLEADVSLEPVKHPMLDQYFSSFENGHYGSDIQAN